MTKLLIILSATFFVFALSAADSETVKGMKKDADTFKKEMSVKMDQLDHQINELKAKSQTKGAEVKESTIKDLESARDSMKTKMNSMSETSKETWSSWKKSMAESMDSLNAKVQKALKQ
jgi:hypothetical protein